MKTMVTLIRNTAGVRCREVVRFSEGPLWEVRLYIYDMIFYRFSKFMSRCLDMDHPLVSFIVSDSMHLAYSFNFLFGKVFLMIMIYALQIL